MSRYIDADAFIAEKRALYCKDCDMRMGVYEIGDAPCKSCGINDMLDALDDFPAADVAPVIHAHWKHDYWAYIEMCSSCERWVSSSFEYAYCPNCGAKMDEVTEK